MTTRVVVMLETPASHFSVYFATKAAAHVFVASWAEWQRNTLTLHPGFFPDEVRGAGFMLQSQLLSGGHPDDPPGTVRWSVLLKSIVGMYIANDEPTPAERVAAAIERQAREGDEWRDQ